MKFNKSRSKSNIVNDGLVLYLDAGIKGSYSGSGTTWTDLAGNNNGTLSNNVEYNNNNGGSLVFNGVNTSASLPVNFFSYPSLTTFTISLWFKSSQTNGGTLFGQQNTVPPVNGFVPVIYLRSDGRIRVEPFWTGSVSINIESSSVLNNNSWHNITTTFNSGTNQLYVNGVYNTQRTGLTLNSYSSSYSYFIGFGKADDRGLGSNYFSGNISNFIFYNRALSATEVKQNFEATRHRFGI